MAELSGFEVLGLLNEIGSTLRGTYVNNVYTSGTSQLIRARKPDAPDAWVVLSPRKGVWVSEKVAERAETSEFTTRLRGELERARFVGASQVDLDRVFELSFEAGSGKKLIVEMMPPGNIIVTDQDGRISLVLNEVRSAARRVVKGGTYQPPKQNRVSPLAVDAAFVKSVMEEEKSAGKALGKHIGLPRKYVAEVLARLGLEDDSPSHELKGREEEVAKVVAGMVAEAKDNPKPSICETPDGVEIFAVPPRGSVVKDSANTLSELCDRLFLTDATSEEEKPPQGGDRRKELEATVSKLKAESSAFLGEASRVRAAAEAARGLPLEEAKAVLKGAGLNQPREPKSPAAIASALFDHAKRLELKAAESSEAAARLEKRLSRESTARVSRTKSLPRRSHEWYEKFRWFMTSGGRLAVGGRDAQSNTLLVKRHLEDGDVVYHADLFGSPFFVLKGGVGQTQEEVVEMAQATVSFSSGWKTGLGAADAYWVLKDQVSGSAESGEYLPRGSFVIRGKKNFVRHALLQLAVGLDKGGRVVAGPESAVRSMGATYVVLVPHREKASDTAKKVLKEFSPAGAVSLDEVVRALPSGGGKVVRRREPAESSG